MKSLLMTALVVGLVTAGVILYLAADITGEIDHNA
jgi:multisubunit Na+/H+ antiporter MnhC subunit